jgi:hypothetical protein
MSGEAKPKRKDTRKGDRHRPGYWTGYRARARAAKIEPDMLGFVCVWCGCNSRDPQFVCSAPDGNGHLYEGPTDRANNPYRGKPKAR